MTKAYQNSRKLRIINNAIQLHFFMLIATSTVQLKPILNELKEKIKPGTVILFDEYFNYIGWQHHEYKAFLEFIKDFDYDYEYECYHSMFTQVGVKIVQRR